MTGRVLSSAESSKRTSLFIRVDTIEIENEHQSVDSVVKATTNVTRFHVGESVVLTGTLSAPALRSANEQSVQSRSTPMMFFGEIHATRPTFSTRLRDRLLMPVATEPTLTQEDAALIRSLLFGDDAGLTRQTKDEFLAAGLLHVLVASGANLLLLERSMQFFVFPLWKWFRLPWWIWIFVQISFGWMYADLCGLDISIVRAACMCTYRLVGQLAGRRGDSVDGFLWTAAVLSAGIPSKTFSVSGILSFLATAAVHTVLFRDANRGFVHQEPGQRHASVLVLAVRETWQVLREMTSTTWRVELFIFPVVVSAFHQWTPFSLLSNLLAEPVLMALLPLCAATVTAGNALTAVWGGQRAFEVLCYLVHLGLTSFQGIVEYVANFPFALLHLSASWTPYAPWAILLCLSYRKVVPRLVRSLFHTVQISQEEQPRHVL